MIHVPTNGRHVPIPTKPRGTTPPVTPILRAPIEHGTLEGYRRHAEMGYTPCLKCAQAALRAEAERPTPKPEPEAVPETVRDGFKHGTAGGYQKHRKRGEKACDDCLKGLAAYRRAYRERRAA